MNYQRLRHRKERRSPLRLLLTVAVFGVLLTALCGFTAGGCNSGTPLHQAIVASDTIANSLNTAASINHDNALETPAEKALVASYILQAAQANTAFTAELQTLQANGGALNTKAVLADFNTLTLQLDALQTDGILHIKDPGAQALFSSVIATIRNSIQEIQLLTTATGRNHAPRRSPLLPLACLVMTPELLEEIIAALITVLGDGAPLVQKLLAMKAESDAALLADAAKANSEAIATAEEDVNAAKT